MVLPAIIMQIFNLLMKRTAALKLVFILSMLGLAFCKNSENDLPRIPVYIGRGYNLLHGNPKSDSGIDPGFTHQIMIFTYNQNEKTEDGRFLVPDHISHRQASACSYSTEINKFRGTQSYQNDLKTKAEITAGYDGPFGKASFSLSTSYQRVHNSTISENHTLTHATAQCQYYEMSLNLFTPNNISSNFVQGVKSSFASNDWKLFIEQFGSHFAYEVIMGGRATQQIEYTSQSQSTMESLQLDIGVTAKASFAGFFADSSFDYHKYDSNIKYSQQLSNSRKEFYIGGQPLPNKGISYWQQTIYASPMPISYKLLPLSQLFHFIEDKAFNVSGAKTSFLKGLDSYCQKINCKPATPDKPKPPPAKIDSYETEDLGGAGGSAVYWFQTSPTLNTKKIIIRSSDLIGSIQLELSDGITSIFSPQVGGTKGTVRDPWVIPNGEYVTQVEYRYGKYLDSLTFITNKGNKSPKYGGEGGGYHLMTFKPGYRLIGLHGWHDNNVVYKLGFYLDKTLYGSYGESTVTQTNLRVQ